MNDELPAEINLKDDELVQKIYQRSVISFYLGTLLPGAIGGLVFVAIGAFSIIVSVLGAMQMLIPSMQDFYIFLVVIIFSIYGIVIVFAAIIGKPYVLGHKYIITNKRIILFKKFIIITRRDIQFDKITDYLVLQGVLGRWKNYGDIQPITAGMEFGLSQLINSFKGLTDPYAVKKEIQKFTQKT